MWTAAGLAAFLISRLLKVGRPRRWLVEGVLAIVAAIAAGLVATALDFGGWRESDWRAGTFAFLVGFGAIGVGRAGRLALRRR